MRLGRAAFAKRWQCAFYAAKKIYTNRLHLRKRWLELSSLAATTNQHDNMTTILASKADFAKNRGFYRGVTLHAATGNVYQLIESYTNGAATLELIGSLQDVPEWMFDALLADDRARCTL